MLGQSVECQITNPIFQHNERDPYNVPTPNQSSLGTFGVIPVSPYTGKADISIPIYQTSQRDVVLDINLAYDSSGLLINQLPGWTGHNWTLNAGGAITRKVNGRPDEINFKGTGAGTNVFLKNFQGNILEMTNHQYNNEMALRSAGMWDYYQDMMLDLLNQEYSEINRLENFQNYFISSNENIGCSRISDANMDTHDSSADIFYFNFMGISGCFFYGNDGNWKVRSDHNIFVQFDVNDSINYIESIEQHFIYPDVRQPKTIKGFTLIDECGNRFIFGGDKNCIEYSMSLAGQTVVNTTEPWTATSWMLKEAQDRYGNVLYKFYYSRGRDIVQIQNAHIDLTCKSIDHIDNPNYHGYHFPKTFGATINLPVYLDSIIIADGTCIKFNSSNVYSDAPKSAVAEIYPNLNGSGVISSILESTYPLLTSSNDQYDPHYIGYSDAYKNFMYSDLHFDDYLDSMNIRKLDDISICYPKTNGISVPDNVYTFCYDLDSRMHLSSVSLSCDGDLSQRYEFDYNNYCSVPKDYLTPKFDFWGYYNGIDYNSNNSDACSVVSDSAKLGMLTKITYPTGGYSIVNYEQNSYSSYMSEDRQNLITLSVEKQAGGLRVKVISNYDENNVLVSQTTYDYKDKYGMGSSGVLSAEIKTHYIMVDNYYIKTLDVITAAVPMSNSFAPTIGYNHVREIFLDGSSINYSFSNFSTEQDEMYICSRFDTLITPYDELTSRQYMCGKLLSKILVDCSGDTLFCEHLTYSSDSLFNETNYVTTTCLSRHPQIGTVGSIYKLYYFKPEVTSKLSKIKFGGKWVTDETVYDRQHFNIVMQDSAGHEHSSDVWKTLSESTTRGSSTVKSEFSYPFLEFDEDVITHNVNDTIFLLPILPRLDDPDSPLPRVNPDAPAHPIDETLFPNPLRDRMIANKQLSMQFCIQPIRNRNYLNNSLIDGQETAYRMVGEMPVPDYVISYASDTTECDTVCKYISYDSRFRPLCIVDRNNVCKTLYWNNRNQLIGIIANGSADDCTEVGMDVVLNSANSALFSSAPIATNLYEYDHHGKVVRTLSNNRIITQFEYDLFGRLTKSKNQFGETTKRYYYNYGMTGNTNASSH